MELKIIAIKSPVDVILDQLKSSTTSNKLSTKNLSSNEYSDLTNMLQNALKGTLSDELVLDNDFKVRVMTFISAMNPLDFPVFYFPLLMSTTNYNESVRSKAIEVLGIIGSFVPTRRSAIIHLLNHMLQSKYTSERWEAARSLAIIVAETLDKDAIESLLIIINNTNSTGWSQIMNRVLEMGPNSSLFLPSINKLLNDKPSRAIKQKLLIITRLIDKPNLIRRAKMILSANNILNSPFIEERSDAIIMLGYLTRDIMTLTDILKKSLKDLSPRVATSAIKVISWDERLISEFFYDLVKLINVNNDYEVMRAALMALQKAPEGYKKQLPFLLPRQF
jgi:hypothetical protein